MVYLSSQLSDPTTHIIWGPFSGSLNMEKILIILFNLMEPIYNVRINLSNDFGGQKGRHEKSLKISSNQIFPIWTVHTFFRNKLPIYENVGEEMNTFAANCYWFWNFSLQYGLFSQEMNHLLLFWQNVHIFSHKCPWTRFVRFSVFLKITVFYSKITI